MKISLDHLPVRKQQELQHIVQIITEAVHPEKIILFGSHATGRWQEDAETATAENVLHDYGSDYDLLVIVRADDQQQNYIVQKRIAGSYSFHTPVSVIVHDLDYVNTLLSEGQYFFTEIRQQGILLYDAGTLPLAEQRALTPAERKKIAHTEFKRWHRQASVFLESVYFFLENEQYDLAAFMLHQVAENTCHAILLVFSGYKPRTNDLEKLLFYVKRFTLEIRALFPRDTEEEVHLFELLRSAYSDARYHKAYTIEEDELHILIARVQKLMGLAEKICGEKIASLDKADGDEV